MGEIARRDEQLPATVVKTLTGDTMKQQIAKALPKHLGVERFLRLALTMLRNPGLQKCSDVSLMAAVMEAAQNGLELDGVLGHGYIVPYKGEAQFIPGYRGLIQLALRTGEVNHVEAATVWANDDFFQQRGDTPKLHHVPTTGDRGPARAYYAVIVYKNGMRKWEVMSSQEIESVKERSPSVKSSKSPWNHKDDKHQMAQKTAIRRVLKTAGLSPEITRYAAQEEYHEAGLGTKFVESEVTKSLGTKAVTERLTQEAKGDPDWLPDAEIEAGERQASREE